MYLNISSFSSLCLMYFSTLLTENFPFCSSIHYVLSKSSVDVGGGMACTICWTMSLGMCLLNDCLSQSPLFLNFLTSTSSSVFISSTTKYKSHSVFQLSNQKLASPCFNATKSDAQPTISLLSSSSKQWRLLWHELTLAAISYSICLSCMKPTVKD